MSATPLILRFEKTTIEANEDYDSSLWNITLDLAAGDLGLVLLEEEHVHLPLADAAQGLLAPTQGRVTFQGQDWQSIKADQAAALRGKVGRVFLSDESWVSNLDMDENILLAQRHHTRRSVEDIRQEAWNLAHMFGLPGLPMGRHSGYRRQDLQKAACIRAFLGGPRLIILENPERGVQADLLAPLINAVSAARKQGAAVLWLTLDRELWDNPDLRASCRGRMFGSQMQMLEEEP